MMIPSLAFALLAHQRPSVTTTSVPQARLVGASLFKNGFAITQRIIDIEKPGTTTVLPVPQGAMGTLWFTPSDGTVLDSVVVENESLTGAKLPASSVEEILSLNVGRTVTLLITESGPPSRLICRIVSVSGTIVVVQTTAGLTRVLGKGTVVGVEGKDLKSQSNSPFVSTRRVMRIRTLGKPGKVRVVALERNLSWSPAYAVNLLPDGKNLSLVAKATVVNDLERLVDLDCRLVTGFPNLPYADTLDPLVAWYMGGGMPGGFPGGAGGFGGGGFQNQQAAARETRRGAVGYDQNDNALLARALAPDGESLGELFFYHRPGVSVDVGGRAAYTLFRTTTPYETVYAWDIGDPAPGQARFEARILPPGAPSQEEIWQTLRFVNNAKVPLTTGPATTFSEGEIIGQDALKYASPGQTAELRVTRSLDVSADYTEEEVSRERGFIKGRNGDQEYSVFDRVTARGTLSVLNRKSTPVKVRIRKAFTGEWVTGDGSPDVKTTAAGLRQPNPTGNAEWIATVAPGATLKLTYTTRLLVSS
jgi:hypothetical protein